MGAYKDGTPRSLSGGFITIKEGIMIAGGVAAVVIIFYTGMGQVENLHDKLDSNRQLLELAQDANTRRLAEHMIQDAHPWTRGKIAEQEQAQAVGEAHFQELKEDVTENQDILRDIVKKLGRIEAQTR